jgi:cytochrome c peroxidase
MPMNHKFTLLIYAIALIGYCTTSTAADISQRAQAPIIAPVETCAINNTKDAVHRRDAHRTLGEKLFFDKKLSRDQLVNCASCHQADQYFSDGRAVSIGVEGQLGTRNAPSLLNVAKHTQMGWDGRRHSLADQVLRAFTNSREHALPSLRFVEERVRSDAAYRTAWASAFPEFKLSGDLTKGLVCAMSEYVAGLSAAETRFERYLAGDRVSLNAEEQRGLELFSGRARCASCHVVKDGLLTDNDFHAVGIGSTLVEQALPQLVLSTLKSSEQMLDAQISSDAQISKLGKFLGTKRAEDIGKFRTPSLRYVSKTAPYMHDGSIADLESALEHGLYYQGFSSQGPAVLTSDERAYLIAFLKAL